MWNRDFFSRDGKSLNSRKNPGISKNCIPRPKIFIFGIFWIKILSKSFMNKLGNVFYTHVSGEGGLLAVSGTVQEGGGDDGGPAEMRRGLERRLKITFLGLSNIL